MAITKLTDTNLLAEAIKQGITKEAERLFTELKDKLVKDFESRKDEIVSGICLNIMGYVQFETMRDNLVITIRKDTPHSTQ